MFYLILIGTCIHLFILNRLIPESVRWLVSQKKYQKAEKILKVAAKFNKREIPEDSLGCRDLEMTQIRQEDTTKRFTIIDMVRTPQIRRRTLVLSYVW